MYSKIQSTIWIKQFIHFGEAGCPLGKVQWTGHTFVFLSIALEIWSDPDRPRGLYTLYASPILDNQLNCLHSFSRSLVKLNPVFFSTRLPGWGSSCTKSSCTREKALIWHRVTNQSKLLDILNKGLWLSRPYMDWGRKPSECFVRTCFWEPLFSLQRTQEVILPWVTMGQSAVSRMENASVQVLFHCHYIGWVGGCLCKLGSSVPSMSSINHASIVQTHTCQRVVGDHPPGIDCLPDEQVIPLLLW